MDGRRHGQVRACGILYVLLDYIQQRYDYQFPTTHVVILVCLCATGSTTSCATRSTSAFVCRSTTSASSSRRARSLSGTMATDITFAFQRRHAAIHVPVTLATTRTFYKYCIQVNHTPILDLRVP